MAQLPFLVPGSAIVAAACAWSIAAGLLEFGLRHAMLRVLASCLSCVFALALFQASGLDQQAAAFAASVVALCLCIGETDLRKRLVPDFLVLGLLLLALSPWSALSWPERATGAALLGCLFIAVRQWHYWARTKEGLGLGDVKLAVAAGALLGAQTGLIAVTAAASIMAAGMIVSRRREPAPFGAGLAVVTIGALYVQAVGA